MKDLVSIKDKQDIAELKHKIGQFQTGKMDEERFRHYRLTRGVYGQRQFGVHMFRTKLPYGSITADQLRALSNISSRYATANLHLTTRQNIQFHYVKLEDSVAIWEELSAANLTAREACGNTVRNVTACPYAGINPEEPFDVTPHAHATFEYFLRNPICQDMGRKIKITFSSSEKDSAFAYFHDFGFIPKTKEVDGETKRGFTVKIGGGLGALSIEAITAYDFLPEDQILPFMEAALRVFDRHGERAKRQKARMKFLVKSLGKDEFMRLVHEELAAIENSAIAIDQDILKVSLPKEADYADTKDLETADFLEWKATNAAPQKQDGYFSVGITVPLGDVSSETGLLLADIVDQYAADDIRISINQGLVLRYVKEEALPHIYQALTKIGLAESGFDKTTDITACPGTDTCNLGVSNSTSLALELSSYVRKKYPDLVNDDVFKIKISGCMNSCGQHMAASFGLHGSSIRVDKQIIPAMQIVLGGGLDENGKPYIADKILKVPTKRVPVVLDVFLADLKENNIAHADILDYVKEKGRKYFYGLFKDLASTDDLDEMDYVDWGQEKKYIQAVGVGECAGVSYDLVSTILGDALEQKERSLEYYQDKNWPGAIYSAYSAQVIAAKAMLLSIDKPCNTHIKILEDFQEFYPEFTTVDYSNFSSDVLRMKKEEPSEAFAKEYLNQAEVFVTDIVKLRERQMGESETPVISNYYKA